MATPTEFSLLGLGILPEQVVWIFQKPSTNVELYCELKFINKYYKLWIANSTSTINMIMFEYGFIGGAVIERGSRADALAYLYEAMLKNYS